MAINTDFTLDAKYRLQEGVVFLSGIQALVRLPLDQRRGDQRHKEGVRVIPQELLEILGRIGRPRDGLRLSPDVEHRRNLVEPARPDRHGRLHGRSGITLGLSFRGRLIAPAGAPSYHTT